MELTKDLAYCELQQILQDKVLLVVGTGASMALDPRFGMGALSSELLTEIPKHIDDNDEAKKQWDKVAGKLKEGIDLENALKETTDRFLRDNIVRVTGDFLVELDEECKLKILNNETQAPIEHFIEKLVKRPEFDPVLDIITPNYDLLIEHCCDKMRIPYITGFTGGIKKCYNWEEAVEQMIYTKYIPIGKKRKKVERTKKHVRLYKVHGSLNWFKNDPGDNLFGEKFEDNSLVYCKNSFPFKRLIITPGDEKYQEAFLNTFDFFSEAYRVMPTKDSFVFIGYGFNDMHIQKKIVDILLENKKQGIIITKELTENAEDLLEKSDKLWAVYNDSSIHDGGSGNDNVSFIYNKSFRKPLKLDNSGIWKIQEFSRDVLGE